MVWSMRALESLLENVRCKKIEELYATDWSETPTPDRSPSVQWRMVQKVSRSLSVLDGLLNEVRCKQTEQLMIPIGTQHAVRMMTRLVSRCRTTAIFLHANRVGG